MVKKRNQDFSTHKSRSIWFSERTCWPLRDAHPGLLEKEWSKWSGAEPDPSEPQWQCAGPYNVAGRVTSLVVHPHDHRRLIAGSAAGGVWRTRKGEESWEPCWPRWASPNIGAFALHPANPELVYCASGEANLSGDSYAGNGVYVSPNWGDDWTLLAPAADCGLPRRIGTIGVHPFAGDGQSIYLGGVTHDERMPSALFASPDSGRSWDSERFFTSRNYWCHSIVFHPDGLVYAALHTNGMQNGIWRLNEDGWEHLEVGLPSSELMGRTSLAISPSQPNTLYAVVADWHGKQLAGIFRSRNKGERWERITGDQFTENQMSYNNCIAVHPDDPDFVVWGGTDLHLTRDSGKNWVRATQWDAKESRPVYVHGDHHVVVMPGGDVIYSGNDGGVAVSENAGKSWRTLDQGMVTSMFYDIDVAPTNSRVFGGGAQDNGTLLTGIGPVDGEFQRVLTGDGGWTIIDPTDESHVFGSAQNVRIFRHPPADHWDDASWKDVSPKDLTNDEAGQTAIAVMIMDPAPREGQKTIWAGSKRLWRTANNAGTWFPMSPVFDGSVITAIEISDANPEQILVGTTNGRIFRSRDGGETWSGNLAGPEIPMRLISQIETHPKSAEKVVVTVAGTGVVSRLVSRAHPQPGSQATSNEDISGISHVFYSEDGGSSWRSIDTKEMPDVAYHSAVFETREPYRLFVSNDCGVWMTKDMRHWTDLSATLPNATVSSLVYHHDDRILTAATYGRGIWRLSLPSPSRLVKNRIGNSENSV